MCQVILGGVTWCNPTRHCHNPTKPWRNRTRHGRNQTKPWLNSVIPIAIGTVHPNLNKKTPDLYLNKWGVLVYF